MSNVLSQADPAGGFGAEAAIPPSCAAGNPAASALPDCSDVGSRQFPAYTRSLLRIKIPVAVTLAEKRQPLGRIIEIGPGSILQFDKSCEEMLELSVGGYPVAYGEAVKVGDKFGLRITAIKPIDERFVPLRRPESGQP